MEGTFEEKLERSLAPLQHLAIQMRVMVRLVAPVIKNISDRHAGFVHARDSVALANCRICTPPPEWLECPDCGYCTQTAWMYGMHAANPPEWCAAGKRKRARTGRAVRSDYVRSMSARRTHFKDELDAAVPEGGDDA